MDSEMVQNILKKMKSERTEKLIKIWRENDRTKYSDEAFEAVNHLLEKREETIPPQLPMKKEELVESYGDKFFSFRTMISTTLIKIIYILGMIGFTIGGVIKIIQANQSESDFGKNIFIGFCIVVLGNIVWRIVCEIWILLFSIHDILSSIERKLK